MTGPIKCSLAVLAIFTTPAFAADLIQCPEKVEVRQEISAPVQGWIPAVDPAPSRLAGITFFDGEPKEQASLAPDRESKVNGKSVATWNFNSNSRPTWVACRYAGTTVTLTKELPKGVKSCSITFTPIRALPASPRLRKCVAARRRVDGAQGHGIPRTRSWRRYPQSSARTNANSTSQTRAA
jgi:hypothetical protein